MTAGPTQIVSYPQRLCFRTTLEILTLLLTAGARFPAEGNILDTEPWDEVHAFAREMSKFYVTEANWRSAAYRHLRLIFHARKGPQALSVGMHTRSETSTRRVWFTVVPTVELCLYQEPDQDIAHRFWSGRCASPVVDSLVDCAERATDMFVWTSSLRDRTITRYWQQHLKG